MAVLQLDPTKAPDFTGTSQILAQAGLSMERAFGSARNLLSSYQEGQTERADNEVFAEIAKLKTQEQIDAYFDGDGIAGRPISKAARERLGSMRSNLANLNTVQQQTAASIASQSRQNDVEGRQATDFQTREKQRLAVQSAGSQLLAAQRASSGESPGTAANGPITQASAPGVRPAPSRPTPPSVTGALKATPNPQATRLALARTIQAEAGNQDEQGRRDVGSVIANRTADGSSIDDVIFKPGAFSAWNSTTVNLDGSSRAQYANGDQGQDMTFTPSAENFAIADSIIAGTNPDQTGGATSYFNPDISQPVWGNDGFQRRGDHVFGTASTADEVSARTPAATAGSPTVPQVPGSAGAQLQQAGAGGFDKGGFAIPSATADTGNGPTPEGTALLDQMVRDGVHPSTVENMRDALKANREGVRVTKAAFDHKTNQENLATLRLRIAADPDFTTAADGNAEFLRLTKKFSAVDRQAFAASENNLADVMSVLVPDVEKKRNLSVYNAIKNEIRIGEDQLNSMVQHRILNNAIEFGSSDPVTPLIAKLRIGNDGETHPLWGLFGPNADDNVLRKAISQLAQSIEPPVTDGVAAAAMFDIFERDPWGTNSVGNRFDFGRAKTFIETNLNAAAVQTYREERTRIEDRAGELNKAQIVLTDLRRQKVKTKDKGRKSTLSGQIKQLELILEGGQTPKEYERAKSDAAETGVANRALANAAAVQPVDFGPDIDPGSAGVQQLPPASLSLTPPSVARPSAGQFLQLGLGS